MKVSQFANQFEGNEEFVRLINCNMVKFDHMMDEQHKARTIAIIKHGVGTMLNQTRSYRTSASGKQVICVVTDRGILVLKQVVDGKIFDLIPSSRSRLNKYIDNVPEEILALADANRAWDIFG